MRRIFPRCCQFQGFSGFYNECCNLALITTFSPRTVKNCAQPDKDHGLASQNDYKGGMNKTNFIKKALISSFSIVAAFASVQSFAADTVVDAESIVVDLALDNAFIAERGFDNNDNIQVVIEGYLPNSCYTLTQAQTNVSPEAMTVKISQIAARSVTGICENEAALPPDLAAQRYFWKVVDVGLLSDVGQYRLSYSGRNGTMSKVFNVGLAPSDHVDNMSYVNVTNAFAASETPTSETELEFRITGEITSTCAEISEDYVVEKVGDVYVLLLNTVRSEDYCMPTSRPFYKVIKVPTPEAGRYLLHARSIGGESKNKIFSVVNAQ